MEDWSINPSTYPYFRPNAQSRVWDYSLPYPQFSNGWHDPQAEMLERDRMQWLPPGGVQIPGESPNPALNLSGLGQMGYGYMRTDCLWWAASAASSALAAYHGYRRNDSVAWGVIWGVLGGIAPIITPAIALAQGFGQRQKGE